MPATQILAMSANSLQSPPLGVLIQTVFACILIGGLVCEALPLVLEATQLLKKLARTIRDFRSGIWYNPFKLEGPIIIRQPEIMQELSDNPKLSQRAVYSDLFGFKYNLANKEVGLDPTEVSNVRYRLYQRAIRINGLSQVDRLLPHLQAKLESVVEEKIDPYTISNDWTSINIAPLMRDFATGMLGVYFFGQRLSSESDFSSAMSSYYSDIMRYSKILPLIPNALKSMVHNLMTKNNHALGVLFARLRLAADTRHNGWKEDEEIKRMTLYHNLLTASTESHYWNETLVIQACVGLWFAASHQPWINLHFVFVELCARPDYADILRNEISSMERFDYETITRLPILDSFMKEVARLNTLDKLAVRRKALQPYTFSHNGPHVATGQIACLSAWELLHDESRYPKNDEFDGFRFVKDCGTGPAASSASEARGTSFVEASKDFPIWGIGSKACPGRWHASLVIKMTIIHILKRYEFRLADKVETYRWFWEVWQLPYESSRVQFRRL